MVYSRIAIDIKVRLSIQATTNLIMDKRIPMVEQKLIIITKAIKDPTLRTDNKE